jgi:murein DD-endopeptidase MepM/ murein hydrolase activator NlpD
VVYESLEADGESLRTGRVLSAEFVNNGRKHEGVWFEEPGQRGAYYGFNGESSRKFYLSSPLEFSRVSSGYGMRFHPISGTRKAHLGVDYAAPTGTPVRTIADGVVEFAGVQRGYGNVIIIRHRSNQTTLFAHLSRIGVRQGQKVDQGDWIGAVGSTGASTGPHLHFEFRDNGVHQDPLVIARQSESVPINPAARARFDAVAQLQRVQLNAAASVQQASAE